nr:cardiotrophin-2-like [Pogona vitticeps]
MCLSLASSLLAVGVALIHMVSPEPGSCANATITQTYNLVRLMQANTTVLLNTYLSHQGSPFSEPGFFNTGRLHYDGVPTIAIHFLEWRSMTDMERLGQNYRVYSIFFEFLQLIWDDQLEINPYETELLEMLKATQLHIKGLLSNLTGIMCSLGSPPTPLTDPLMMKVTEADTFEKKFRGSVVCYRYRQWVDRTVRDFSLLQNKYRS